MNKPIVSVIMGVFNSEKYLKEAIDSILNQSFKEFEFIIIDDASTDSSGEIINSYTDKRIKYVKNDVNLGLTKSLNKAIQLAQADIIARMDGDDISFHDRLNKQVAYLESHKSIKLLGSNAKMIDENGKFLQDINTPTDYNDILAEIFSQNPFVHSTVCFRKDFVQSLGGYDEEIKKSQDYDLWFRIILNKGKVENLPDALLEYRTHSESISIKTSANQQEYVNKILIKNLTNFINRPISETEIKNLRQIKFFGQKLKNPFSIFGVLGIYREIILSVKNKFPEQQRAYTNIRNIMNGLIDRQTNNKYFKSLLQTFYIRDL